MFDRFAHWHSCLRGAALLAFITGWMVVPVNAREDAECATCFEAQPGKWQCARAGAGEQGFTGKCWETESGCSWSLGAQCMGVEVG